MKKFTLFVCALAASAVMFAAPFKQAVKVNHEPVFKEVQGVLNGINAAQTGADTVVVPYRSYQTTYRVGKPSDGFGYDYYQQGLVSPFYESIIFFNDSMYAADWYDAATGIKLLQNQAYINWPLHFGENELPLMKLVAKTDTVMPDWQIANTYVKYYWEGYSDFYTAINVAPAYYLPLTQCSRYTEALWESEYGLDCYKVGAGDYGTYSYGTKLTNPWQATTTMDSLLVVFNNKGIINIDHITAGIYTAATSAAGAFPGENDHVRLSIHPLTADNKIDYKTTLAEAVATADNVTWAVDSKGNQQTFGMIEWDFLEEDPVTGALTPAPIVLEGGFVVLLDEYNSGTANFGFFSDYYRNGVDCKTYFPWYDQTEQKSYTSSVWGNNIALNLVAYFPVFNAPDTIVFDAETGLVQELEIPSNVWEDDIEIVDGPAWVNVVIETQYTQNGDDYEHNYINKLKLNVASSAENLEGTVELNCLGLPVNILIQQNGAQGIENVTFKNNNKLYNVLGQEVNEDYKGVVIRNGEKFIK